MRLAAAIAAFLAFTAYTVWVMAGNGVMGFVSLAGREPWGLQLLIDLLVMLALFAALGSGKTPGKHGLAVWPWVAATMVMGLMGALGLPGPPRMGPAAVVDRPRSGG